MAALCDLVWLAGVDEAVQDQHPRDMLPGTRQKLCQISFQRIGSAVQL